jgi:Lsr2
MAQHVEITNVCDMPGHDSETESAETIGFAFAGQPMEIDVCAAHAAEFRQGVGQFIAAARPYDAVPSRTRRGRTPGGNGYRGREHRERSAAIRAWAAKQGLHVSDRGRIPRGVVTRYERETGQ